MIASLLTDAATCGLQQAAEEHLGEIAGHFDNDPVTDYGQATVDQARELIEMILDQAGRTDKE